MASWIPFLFFALAGIILLWFGFTLLISLPRGLFVPAAAAGKGRKPQSGGKTRNAPGSSGISRFCPVCSAKLTQGERVKSAAFPSLGGLERLMHISGCIYCLQGDRLRVCPVCGGVLREDEYLIARLFEKPVRSHVHVLGCTRCKMQRL
ncbi:MAG: hypothetical protein LBD31_03615 [Treponema sp.]|nr:hypothetical protein [Treponema sp.]